MGWGAQDLNRSSVLTAAADRDALNQAARRDTDRFAGDFAYRITPHEFTDLMSQIVISNSGEGGAANRLGRSPNTLPRDRATDEDPRQ